SSVLTGRIVSGPKRVNVEEWSPNIRDQSQLLAAALVALRDSKSKLTDAEGKLQAATTTANEAKQAMDARIMAAVDPRVAVEECGVFGRTEAQRQIAEAAHKKAAEDFKQVERNASDAESNLVRLWREAYEPS